MLIMPVLLLFKQTEGENSRATSLLPFHSTTLIVQQKESQSTAGMFYSSFGFRTVILHFFFSFGLCVVFFFSFFFCFFQSSCKR